MARGLRRLLDTPMLWAAAYLLLIPAFGTAYGSLGPQSFYDANVQRERGLAHDATRLEHALTGVVRTQARGATWRAFGRGVRLVPNTAVVIGIRHETNGRLLADIEGRYRGIRKVPVVEGRFAMSLSVDVNQYLLTRRPGQRSSVSLVASQWIDPSDGAPGLPNPRVSDLFSPGRVPSAGGNDFSLVEMPLDVYQRLVRYYRAVEGDPYYASGLWARMTYFSAIAVTTVGFGEITPVSATARVLVAAEAVLGILFVGLFLNAAALRVGRTRRSGVRSCK